MLKRISFLLAILLASIATAMAYTVEEIPNVHVKDKTQYVSNPDGVLKQTTVDSLNRCIAHIWQSSTAEVTAVVVNSIDGNDIDDFATSLFRHWGIGKSDNNNGVLLLVSTEERKAVIRSGYGAEGILPDIICGRIIRDNMVPHFREGDYDGGLIAAVARIDSLLTTPGAIDELKSKYENDQAKEQTDIFYKYLTIAGIVGFFMLFYAIFLAFPSKGSSDYENYHRLEKRKTLFIVVFFLTIGIGLPALLVLFAAQHCYRNKRRKCPNCGQKMHKLSETEDNNYLTPSQDLEEQLKSVDYDVWRCNNCGETDIFAFPKSTSPYVECPNCHAKTAHIVSDRTAMPAAGGRDGYGVRTYVCKNCGKKTDLAYKIPYVATPVIIAPISGRGGGGGGFGGGSFGGGSTGGGGASGGW